MASQLAEQFEQPIKNMTDYDYAELKHLKLELERTSMLYDQSVAKNLTSKTQLNEDKILSIQKELEEKKVGGFACFCVLVFDLRVALLPLREMGAVCFSSYFCFDFFSGFPQYFFYFCSFL